MQPEVPGVFVSEAIYYLQVNSLSSTRNAMLTAVMMHMVAAIKNVIA